MRILLASSELHPYSKTGGLADMVGALAKTTAQAGNEVAAVTPLYRGVRERFPDLQPFDWKLDLPLGARYLQARVWTRQPMDRLTLYFIDQPQLFDRDGVYQDHGADYADNSERFIFFAKCAVHLARYLPLKPELVHVHDWQTGFVPLFIQHQQEMDGWRNAPRTCLTIHNLAYQGIFPPTAYALANLPGAHFTPAGVEFHGGINLLKAGIAYADVITTVSPRYAREIMTEEFGHGLDALLRHRQKSVFGILNGVDYDEWNTLNNPHLRHHFSARNLRGKTQEKLDVQRELGLQPDADVPFFSSITRLAEQKGVDILLGALEEMLATDMRFVLLGSGSPHYERSFQNLARRHPSKAVVRIGFDEGLSHRIEAGSDFFLMPSRFEPCGLNQMYSQRYGTIPIVRLTGGLDDTVTDFWESTGNATGIKFREYSARALAKAIRKALVLYQTPGLLRRVQRNAMKADFSWERTSQEYDRVYREALACESRVEGRGSGVSNVSQRSKV